MSYVFYLNLCLLPPGSPVSLDALREKLLRRYARIQVPHAVEVEGNQLTLRLGDYNFMVYHVAEPHVLEEAQDIATRRVSDPALAALVAACPARLEMYGDDDPDFVFFNDSILIQECLEEFGDVYIYSPYNGKFTNLETD